MTSMVEAIIDKYGPGDDESFDFIAVPRRRRQESTSSESDVITLPSVLVLDNSGISSIGDTAKLKEMCPNVTELDLTKNSITNWGEVLSILNGMPKLRFLNLCANTLNNDSWPSQETVGSFSALRHLILNNTGISWDITHNLLELCPVVEEIHLSLNEHDDISLPEPFKTYPTVKKIHMSKNNIKNWSELHKVGRLFPNLEHFVNIESQLENLRSHDEEENDMTRTFANMKSLALTQTNVEGWENFEVLKHCPALVELKVLGIPFLEEIAEKQRRQQLISRLPNIQCLNGTPISESEREDAERAFLRLYMDCDEKPSRYFELEAVHGKLDRLAEVDMSVCTRLDLQLDIPFQERKERLEINTQQQVRDLLKTISNIVGLPASKLRVFHQMIFQGQVIDTSLMSIFPKKNLWTYNMSPEDIIICDHKDTSGMTNTIVSFAGEGKLERD